MTAAAKTLTDDAQELIGIAMHLKDQPHWKLQASSRLLAEIATRLLSQAQALPDSKADAGRLERMFLTACADLGAINEALGLDPDDGGAEPILAAIDDLKAAAAFKIEAVPGGMPVAQEPKYGIRDNRLYNRASGEFIPTDEPIFIFRARDIHAVNVLAGYARDVGPSDHAKTVWSRVDDFKKFYNEQPDRIKEPDTASPNRPNYAHFCNGDAAILPKHRQAAPALPVAWLDSLAMTVARLEEDAEMFDQCGQNSTAEDRRARAYELTQMLAAAPKVEAAVPAAQGAGEQDERKAFEKAMNDARFFPAELDFSRTKSPSGREEYANSHLQSNWEGWQTRAAQQVTRPLQEAAEPKCGVGAMRAKMVDGELVGYFAAPAVAQQEAAQPVAWLEKSKSHDAWFLAYSQNPDAETKPLYAAPIGQQDTRDSALEEARLKVIATVTEYLDTNKLDGPLNEKYTQDWTDGFNEALEASLSPLTYRINDVFEAAAQQVEPKEAAE